MKVKSGYIGTLVKELKDQRREADAENLKREEEERFEKNRRAAYDRRVSEKRDNSAQRLKNE